MIAQWPSGTFSFDITWDFADGRSSSSVAGAFDQVADPKQGVGLQLSLKGRIQKLESHQPEQSQDPGIATRQGVGLKAPSEPCVDSVDSPRTSWFKFSFPCFPSFSSIKRPSDRCNQLIFTMWSVPNQRAHRLSLLPFPNSLVCFDFHFCFLITSVLPQDSTVQINK